jgi:hypothetical protein
VGVVDWKFPYKLDDDGHSVERFIERYYGDDAKPSFEDARALLDEIRALAVFVEHLPDEGQEIWQGRGAFQSLKMVVKDGVVRTVLPPGAQRPTERRRVR